MKTRLIAPMMVFVATSILLPHVCLGQGTVYLSNLSLQSAGSVSVASDSWYAQAFATGTNRAGYTLNSIQLRMLGASGNPADFEVPLHTNRWPPVAVYPDYAIAQFTGSTNPTAPGVFTYVPDSPFTLSANGTYFIVVTAGTPVASGSYSWSVAGTYSPNLALGWSGGTSFYSPDGSTWGYNTMGFPQFAVNASPIPEPSAIALLSLGGSIAVVALRRRRQSVRRRASGTAKSVMPKFPFLIFGASPLLASARALLRNSG